jgi:hypothetical protein
MPNRKADGISRAAARRYVARAARHLAACQPCPGHRVEPQRLLRLAGHLGAPAQDGPLEFPIGAQDERKSRDSGLGTSLRQDDYPCLHMGGRIRKQCWLLQYFAEVADKQTLIDNAKRPGADESTCASLEQLPEHNFDAPVDASAALAKPH